MTRINLVNPEKLSRQHLIAEYRELPRIFNLVRKKIDKGSGPSECKIPKEYKLGAGHVTFFYDKLEFLRDRQCSLIKNMKERGYSPSFTDPDISDIGSEWKGCYTPTEDALSINRARIKDRSGS